MKVAIILRERVVPGIIRDTSFNNELIKWEDDAKLGNSSKKKKSKTNTRNILLRI